MTERYMISELPPVTVLDTKNGDVYPVADGSGFVKEMVKLLNDFNKENQALKKFIKDNFYEMMEQKIIKEIEDE